MRLLVVEDDLMLAAALKALFSSKGWEVETAADGVSGVDLARRWRPEVVVLDALLPRLSGFDVCRRLKADADLSRTKILMLTALDGSADLDLAFSSGVDAFVSKPFDDGRLLQAVAGLHAPDGGPPPGAAARR